MDKALLWSCIFLFAWMDDFNDQACHELSGLVGYEKMGIADIRHLDSGIADNDTMYIHSLGAKKIA